MSKQTLDGLKKSAELLLTSFIKDSKTYRIMHLSNEQKNGLYGYRLMLTTVFSRHLRIAQKAFFIGFLLLSFQVQALPSSYKIEQLERLAEQYVKTLVSVPKGNKVEVTASKQDPRTKIPPCQSELTFSGGKKRPPGTNLTVKIMCQDKKAWHQYIPVRIKRLSPVLMAINQLQVGTIINSEHLSLGFIETSRLRGNHFTDIQHLQGATVKRRVNAGQPISTNHICLVCKGQSVTLIVKRGGLELKTDGIALSDGTLGEKIQVQNSRSKRLVHGRVKRIGVVEID